VKVASDALRMAKIDEVSERSRVWRRKKVEDSQEQRRAHNVRNEENFVVVLPNTR